MTGPSMELEKLNAEIDALAVGERLVKYAVPEHVYHASKGIGSTLMAAAFKTMAHYKHTLDTEREQTADMMIGSAVHYLLLEPEFFDARVIKLPDGIVRGVSKKYKEFAEKHPNLIHLKAEELDKVQRMHASVLRQAADYFAGGEPEVSYWFKHKTGLVLKARLDYRIGDGAIDLKTTRHEDAKGFARSVKYDYAVQDSLYRLVTEINDMIFLGVSKSEPHQCFIAKQGDDVRKKTDAQLHKTLELLAFVQELDDFEFPPLAMEVTALNSWEL